MTKTKEKLTLKEKFSNFKYNTSLKLAKLKKKLTPKFVETYKANREKEIANVDLATLTKPINDVQTSGPKKMKDFSQWSKWKTFLVGVIGVLVIIFVWALYSYVIVEVQGRTSFISSPSSVWSSFETVVGNGIIWTHLGYSLQRVLVGYAIAICLSIPVGFIMAWYKPIRALLDPFIQFLRCIPPIAYVPVIVFGFGIGESSKYFIIFLACFLTMTVTIYQGVKNVDLTLVKAAYTFGARDKDLFAGVVVPSSFPFILTAMRLGIGAAMTTLVAAELTGTIYGLGAYINTQGSYLRMDNAIMGIIVLGALGIIMDKILLFVEKSLTRWK